MQVKNNYDSGKNLIPREAGCLLKSQNYTCLVIRNNTFCQIHLSGLGLAD
ncbi:hypothetical protein TTHERM_01132920 (macronuclear) [Tetrahymena thermophila SB210]|uniref:Uncharacterized protein n=1 Tax=Tetrahymena thermophila (strain SB210) TaxID=312017 RepID=Q24HU0_TETTS|nr:hypothetical protein TTHERM_01132920 [Tetrahymena thermophila SB210]EAS07347.1 hypothetical protein TTHERM_01132920 [Tetrahymena thermophila SB210]|eukprot:XP_001027589.1 hypothetical protein TTHERM_01132920 [Tetrahymena thermophila SB210]